jgi:pteridine reductase
MMTKTALVTGASKRIGREIALTLARTGVNVAVHHTPNSANDAQKTLADIRALGVEAIAVSADLSKWDEAVNVGHAALAHFGKIDILVNNASSFTPRNFFDMTSDDLDLELGVHIKGVVALSQILGKTMMQRTITDGYACIVNIVDLGAFVPSHAYVAHNIAKAALESLTHHMMVAMAPMVRVNSICPGLVLMPKDYNTSDWERLKVLVPQNTLGTLDQVTDAVIYLINGPSFINGMCLRIDGGQYWGDRKEVVHDDAKAPADSFK